MIDDAESAADAEEFQGMLSFQADNEGQDFADGLFKGGGFGDLGADVHLHAAQLDVFQPGGAGIDAFDLFEGDAEFIFVGAGGDFGMGFGGDVRIHPHGDGGEAFEAGGDFIDAEEFGFAFDVEGVNFLFEGELNFNLGFADASKDATAGVAAGGDDALQFAGADDVEAAAEVGEHAEDGEVGIGLHGEAHEVIEGGHGVIEFLEMITEGVLGVDVERRAVFFGQGFDGDTFTK